MERNIILKNVAIGTFFQWAWVGICNGTVIARVQPLLSSARDTEECEGKHCFDILYGPAIRRLKFAQETVSNKNSTVTTLVALETGKIYLEK